MAGQGGVPEEPLDERSCHVRTVRSIEGLAVRTSTRRAVDRACEQGIPDLSWRTNLLYDTNTDDVIAGFEVGMPVTVFDRNQGNICQARHEVVAAQRRVDANSLELQNRLATTYQQYIDAKLQVDTYEDEIIPKAKETYNLYFQGFSQGEADVTQLLMVQQSLFRFRLEYLDQLEQLWKHQVNVQGLLTGLNP